MLGRYQMKRGVPARALPKGHRIDIRAHTRHVLRPTKTMVRRYLAEPTDETWTAFRTEYRAQFATRFARDREPFDALAEEARRGAVFLGCSCPTANNPDVRHCHTYLALELMHERYPDLDVVFPA